MLLIRNGKIYTITEGILEKSSILIENGKIKEIGENISVPEGTEIFDAEGKIVMPGFVEAHSHLGLKEDSLGFEGTDHNETSDPVTPHLRAIDAVNPMDRNFEEARGAGVTCAAVGPGSANVIGGQFAAIKTCGNRIDDMIVKAPIGMKCAFGENPKRVYSNKGKTPMTRMGTAGVLRESLFKAKEYNEKLELAKEDSSKAPKFDIKMEALLPVIRGEIPLKAHAHRADDIFTAIRIAKEFGLKLTLDHCTDGSLIVEHIVNEKYDAIVGPSFNSRSKVELKNKGFHSAAALSNAGKKIAITTDSPVIPLQYLPLCAALAAKAGMDKDEAVKAITIYPAEILGIDDRVGSLEVGKDGDVVIWDSHPFDIFANVECTIIEGRIVYKRD